MKRLAILVGVTAVLAASELSAQAGVWIPPACKINTKHFLVNSAQLYLKNATQAKTPDQRATNLRDANRVLNQAVTEGQADNPAVWYFFGRYYMMAEDMAGADSAFNRALKGQPDCKDDIDTQRRNAWVPEVQAAADALNKQDMESAKVHFRKANAIYQGDPIGFYYLANVFTNQGQLDSGIYYYRKTVSVLAPQMQAPKQDATTKVNPKDLASATKALQNASADSTNRETYETSVFNLARLYHQSAEAAQGASAAPLWDSAGVWYQKYQQIKPNDPQAITGAAMVRSKAAHLALERGDTARFRSDTAAVGKVYDNMLAHTDSASFVELFQIGIALFSDQNYDRAVKAFEAALKKNPYYRDVLFNLSSTYLSMGSVKDSGATQAQKDARNKDIGTRMAPIAQRMVDLDPYNRSSLRMLALAYQYEGQQDSVLNILTRAEDLPFEVNVTGFQDVENGRKVTGTVTALEPANVKAVNDSVKFYTDWIPKLADTLANTQKAVQTGKDPATGKIVPAAVKQALQQRIPVLEKRRGELEQQRDRLKGQADQLAKAGTAVPAITFEFLDKTGKVVASQTVPGSNAPVNQPQPFTLTAVGQGIEGWRYKAQK